MGPPARRCIRRIRLLGSTCLRGRKARRPSHSRGLTSKRLRHSSGGATLRSNEGSCLSLHHRGLSDLLACWRALSRDGRSSCWTTRGSDGIFFFFLLCCSFLRLGFHFLFIGSSSCFFCCTHLIFSEYPYPHFEPEMLHFPARLSSCLRLHVLSSISRGLAAGIWVVLLSVRVG